ncbi:COG1361 S-layer family protein [archaeon]|nr:COG1361 S-layer family protein [archaeon]
MKITHVGMLLVLCMSLASADIYEIPTITLSTLGQTPDPAVAGGIVEVKLQLENTGYIEVNNITIGLDYEYPLTQIPGEPESITIKTLAPKSEDYGTTNLIFKVGIDPTAAEGEYKLKITRKAEGITWYDSIESVTIRVTGEEFAALALDTTELQPGEETNVIFTITNTGDAPLQNLAFSWVEEDGTILPIGSDNTQYIKQLAVGKNKNLDYTMVADMDTDPGLYKLDLKLEYEVLDSSGNRVKSALNREIGIIVGGQTSFDVTFSESSEGQTSLSVANIGNNPALAVTVRVPEQDSYSVSGSTASIIGNLDSGDYTIVSFQIIQKAVMKDGSPSGKLEDTPFSRTNQYNNLKVLIEYTDTTGERQTIEKLVPIQFKTTKNMRTTKTSSGLNLPWEIVGIALLLLMVIGFFLYKRFKKKPSDNK